MKLSQSKCTARVRPTLAALAMAIAALPTNAVLAYDHKEYPGSMCNEGVVASHITQASGDIVFDVSGDALNISTTWTRYVTCPLVRASEDLGGSLSNAVVLVYKPSYSVVGCMVSSTPFFGGAGKFESKGDTSSRGGLLPIVFDGWSDTDFSIVNLSCFLPPTRNGEKSGIAHYGLVNH